MSCSLNFLKGTYIGLYEGPLWGFKRDKYYYECRLWFICVYRLPEEAKTPNPEPSRRGDGLGFRDIKSQDWVTHRFTQVSVV